uniref:Ricin B-type lectin domain-containing protein n=1 Tax=Rhabditophanes sp. KR3021 TaxID=114890 RepID=A0AC35U4Z8_9BILA
MLANSYRAAVTAFVVLAIASVGNAQTNVGFSCDTTKLQYCTNLFITHTAWPMTAGKAWQDYTQIDNFFTYTLLAGAPGYYDGLLLGCNGFEQLYSCLGLQNRGCLSVPARLAAGDSPVNAYGIGGVMNKLLFECGAGLFTLTNDNALTCVQNVFIGYRQALTQCQNTYLANTEHDTINGCQYTTDLINCYTAPFTMAGCRRENKSDQWWACETQLNYARGQFPLCDIHCDLQNGPSGHHNYLQTNYKFENEQHHFKMPNIWKQVNDEWKFVEQEQWYTN